jgi:hypothetical protein
MGIVSFSSWNLQATSRSAPPAEEHYLQRILSPGVSAQPPSAWTVCGSGCAGFQNLTPLTRQVLPSRPITTSLTSSVGHRADTTARSARASWSASGVASCPIPFAADRQFRRRPGIWCSTPKCAGHAAAGTGEGGGTILRTSSACTRIREADASTAARNWMTDTRSTARLRADEVGPIGLRTFAARVSSAFVSRRNEPRTNSRRT